MKKVKLFLTLAICCMLSLSAIKTYSEYPIAPHEHTHSDSEKH